MAAQSRTSRYLLLKVWCSVLTLAMVAMAIFLISVKSKDPLPTNEVQPTGRSYIQLTKDKELWKIDRELPESCDSCALQLRNNSIHIAESGVYHFYAHVTFPTEMARSQRMTVTFFKYSGLQKDKRHLFEGIYPGRNGSVFIAKTLRIRANVSVSLVINGPCRDGVEYTYWGAYKL